MTVYGYMIPAIVDHFGEVWLEHGTISVRFHEPVYEGDLVDVEGRRIDGSQLEISLANGRTTAVATMNSSNKAPKLEDYPDRPLLRENERPHASHESLAPGTTLGTLIKRLELNEPAVTAPLKPTIGSNRLAHPAVLLALANEILMRNVVLGPWIHARSEVTNFASARDGDTLTVRGKVIETYERKGHEFVVLDILTTNESRAVQHVRHTAIWKLRRPQSI